MLVIFTFETLAIPANSVTLDGLIITAFISNVVHRCDFGQPFQSVLNAEQRWTARAVDSFAVTSAEELSITYIYIRYRD